MSDHARLYRTLVCTM